MEWNQLWWITSWFLTMLILKDIPKSSQKSARKCKISKGIDTTINMGFTHRILQILKMWLVLLWLQLLLLPFSPQYFLYMFSIFGLSIFYILYYLYFMFYIIRLSIFSIYFFYIWWWSLKFAIYFSKSNE